MIKKFTFILATIISVMSMTISSFAYPSNFNVQTIRTVFNSEGAEVPSVPYVNFNGIKYIPVITGAATIKNGTKITYKNDGEKYFTAEIVDGYTGKAGYYTIWDESKKLRVSGKDSYLKYPAYIISVPDFYIYVSVDDWCKIYGYDMNYWAAKNTIYFTRNGKGLLF